MRPMWSPSLESAHLINHRKKKGPARMVWPIKVSILRNPAVSLTCTGGTHWRQNVVCSERTISVFSKVIFLLCCSRQARTLNGSCDLCPQILLTTLGATEGGEKVLEFVLTTLRPHKSLGMEMRRRKNWTTENLSCVKYDSSEVLVFGRREVVESLVNALVVHLKIKCLATILEEPKFYW